MSKKFLNFDWTSYNKDQNTVFFRFKIAWIWCNNNMKKKPQLTPIVSEILDTWIINITGYQDGTQGKWLADC